MQPENNLVVSGANLSALAETELRGVMMAYFRAGAYGHALAVARPCIPHPEALFVACISLAALGNQDGALELCDRVERALESTIGEAKPSAVDAEAMRGAVQEIREWIGDGPHGFRRRDELEAAASRWIPRLPNKSGLRRTR